MPPAERRPRTRKRRRSRSSRAYLPEQLDPAELERLVRDAVDESGATGPRDMGKVMAVADAQGARAAPMASRSSALVERRAGAPRRARARRKPTQMIARSASIRSFSRRDGVRLVVLGLLMIVALGAILAIDTLPGAFGASSGIAGGVATVDIRAPRALTYTSDVATEQRRTRCATSSGRSTTTTPTGRRRSPINSLPRWTARSAPSTPPLRPCSTTLPRQAALRAAIPTSHDRRPEHARRD